MLEYIAVVAGFNNLEILSYADPIFNKNAVFENLAAPICSGWLIIARLYNSNDILAPYYPFISSVLMVVIFCGLVVSM